MVQGGATYDLSRRYSRPLLPAIRAIIRLADSAQVAVRDRIMWRVLLANATRALDSVQVYHVVDEMLEIAKSTRADVEPDLGPIGLVIDSMAVWSVRDGVPERGIGFAIQLGTVLSDTSRVVTSASWQYRAASILGTAAPPLEASHWVNVPAGTTRLPLDDGKVTLIEFTNWACGVCRKSYPVLNALHQELAGRGLRVIIATGILGGFEGESMPPQQEIAADSAYFSGRYGMPFPIVVGDSIVDVNARRFHIFGAPQFVLVDRRGIVRDTFYNWTTTVAERLGASVRRVLAE
jgi:hypothetical protein